MAEIRSCDHCGGLIEGLTRARLILSTVGDVPAELLQPELIIRDYHATPDCNCIGEVMSLITHADALGKAPVVQRDV